jgi:hypothetical protein
MNRHEMIRWRVEHGYHCAPKVRGWMGATRYMMYIVKYGNDNNESTLIKGLMKSCSRLIKVDKRLIKRMNKER